MEISCCKIEGCKNEGKLHRSGKKYYPRGFCNTHYKKWAKENRDIIEQDKIRVTCCSVEGCESPEPYKQGLCNKHYTRFRKYGDANFVEKRREGQTEHPLYNTYGGMKKRCLSETDKDYPNYGGRGIKICDRWLGTDGFFNFIEDMGERPNGCTLDRKDNFGNYSPENCRWADLNTQNINKRNVLHQGVIYYPKLDKYRSRITVAGEHYELGMFKDLDEAIASRKAAERKYLGHEIEK